ncbi:MAG: WG repeat-containing protein [Treponema sp.]|nr:WG repeat-containing protein [Treponema sp.]
MQKKIFYTLSILIIGCHFLYSESYSLVQKNGLYGIISENKKIVMEPMYNWITISSNSIVCYKERTREIYNSSLELLFSDSWVNLQYYSENEIIIKESMSDNQKLLNLITGSISEFHSDERYKLEEGYREGVGLVWEDSKKEFLYSIADKKGNILLSDIEQAHSVYTNGMLAVIMKDGKSGFVNKKGKMVFETSFYIEPDDIGPRKEPIIRYLFNENYALVKTEEQKWVQYNLKGKKKPLPDNLIPVEYCYENGLVAVMNTESKKYGYINPDFEVVIPFNFSLAQNFVGLYAVVKYDGKEAIIDKKGNVYFSERFIK